MASETALNDRRPSSTASRAFAAALRNRDSVTVHQLGDTRQGRESDRTPLINTINRINAELGRCGLTNSLDDAFRKIETQLVTIERRGGGLQPEPLMDPPPAPTMAAVTSKKKFGPRSKK